MATTILVLIALNRFAVRIVPWYSPIERFLVQRAFDELVVSLLTRWLRFQCLAQLIRRHDLHLGRMLDGFRVNGAIGGNSKEPLAVHHEPELTIRESVNHAYKICMFDHDIVICVGNIRELDAEIFARRFVPDVSGSRAIIRWMSEGALQHSIKTDNPRIQHDSCESTNAGSVGKGRRFGSDVRRVVQAD
jgi:hypothetical protein